ncbi:FAD:protein FMN transferase [Cellulomonas sp. ES6]|uniref:FAD:protein FMN transferase n=1 Tax=Cellulomonas sp. ES6 TaxID=3039384 RepID=UPI0024B67A1D|nr:FAD:protein FMN transferase [Cellulomonas sp. ES6]WHP15976.1 FAD:protein FMN transferase [Cellulomonas sp. ES6]
MSAAADATAWTPSGDDLDAAERDTRVREAAGLPRCAWVAHHMAMPWSVHVRGPAAHAPATAGAVAEAFALVARIDAALSPFRPDSDLSRYRRGELGLDAAPELAAVHRRCVVARSATGGVVDAWGWRDGFDPTGLTKGWAVDRALDALAGLDGDVAVVAGGDVGVRSRSGLPWRVGVEDPADRSRVLAWIDVTDGGVATSGPAARGAHVVDPRTGAAAGGAIRSATVVAETAERADVWATAAVVLGAHAPGRLRGLPGTSGVLVLADGSVHRWAAPA